MTSTRLLGACAIVCVCLSGGGAAQSDPRQGTTYTSPGGITLRLLLDETNVGPEATVGEMVFPPNMDRGGGG